MASIRSPEMPRRAFMVLIAGSLAATPLAAAAQLAGKVYRGDRGDSAGTIGRVRPGWPPGVGQRIPAYFGAPRTISSILRYPDGSMRASMSVGPGAVCAAISAPCSVASFVAASARMPKARPSATRSGPA